MEKCIVTGQQIGLLGGPLYTTYKVLGAMTLAREIGGTAVYWLETNDADFNEINHLEYLDAEGMLRTLTWNIDSRGFSCGRIEIDASLIDMLTEFFDTLRQTEFTPALRALTLRCYVSGRTLGEASMRLARELFGHFQLQFFDPSNAEFKAFIKPILLREAERTGDGEQGNFFCMDGKKRLAVFKQGHDYVFRDGTRADLDAYDLVPNVKTRNLCQDAYFQTHTYVAGPAEIRYISELDPEYAFHGIRKAAVMPRMSVTLLEPKALRLIKKHQISLEAALTLDKAKWRKKILREKTGFDYKQLTQQSRQITKEYLQTLLDLGIDIQKTERSLYQAIKESLGEQRVRNKAAQENVLQAAETLSNLLRPFGQPQERIFNLFYYLNLYGGLAFVDWLYERYDPSQNLLEVANA